MYGRVFGVYESYFEFILFPRQSHNRMIAYPNTIDPAMEEYGFIKLMPLHIMVLMIADILMKFFQIVKMVNKGVNGHLNRLISSGLKYFLGYVKERVYGNKPINIEM